jgi:hypothetical protein
LSYRLIIHTDGTQEQVELTADELAALAVELPPPAAPVATLEDRLAAVEAKLGITTPKPGRPA